MFRGLAAKFEILYGLFFYIMTYIKKFQNTITASLIWLTASQRRCRRCSIYAALELQPACISHNSYDKFSHPPKLCSTVNSTMKKQVDRRLEIQKKLHLTYGCGSLIKNSSSCYRENETRLKNVICGSVTGPMATQSFINYIDQR